MKNTPLLDIYKCNVAELQAVLKTTGLEQFLSKEGIDFSDLLEYSHSDLKELFGESYEIVKTNIYKLLKSGEFQRN
ncbi:MAG: hypothetical protein GY828_05885, partial [Candidatus Gracilibacteria bacterium]|nr:hypothetical protein [Candidatus Gracilibacteria bacterium]